MTNSAAAEDGYCYRYAYDATSREFSWVLIKDNDVTKALGDISDLQTFESETTSWMEETDEGLTTIRSNHTELSGRVDKVVKSSIQLWYTKANTTAPAAPTAQVTSTSTSGNAWRVVVPAYSASYPYYYYCWQYQYEDGTFGWSAVVRDRAMEESQSTSRSAQTTANANIKSSVMLWFSKADATAPAAPTAQVTSTATSGNAWTTVVPTWNGAYPHYFYCYQQQKGDGTWQWTDVVYDRATSEAQQKAAAALPASTFTTFETTTFKTLTDTVDEQGVAFSKLSETVQYGGRNWLVGTSEMLDKDIKHTSPSVIISDGVATFPVQSTVAWLSISITTIPVEDFLNQTWTVSFDYRSDDFSGATSTPYIYIAFEGGATKNGSRTKYRNISNTAETQYVPTSEWQRGSITVKVGADVSWFTSGSGDVNYCGVAFYSHTNKSFQIRKIKLERGPYATPWEYAQDDVTTVSNKLNTVSDTVDGHTQTISSMQQTIAGKADGSTVSTLTTKVNNVSDTVDGHTSSLSSITKTVSSIGTGTVDYSDMGVWERGTTSAEAAGKTYAQMKNDSTTRIRFNDLMPIAPGKYTVTIASGFLWCRMTFGADKLAIDTPVWQSDASSTLTVGEDCRYIIFLLRKGNGTAIVVEEAPDAQLRLTYSYADADEVSTLQQDYAEYKQTTTDSLSQIGQRVTDAEGKITSAETAISQNSDAIALRATKTEAAQMAQPNLIPVFQTPFSDRYGAGTNPDGYWRRNYTNQTYLTILDDGWCHYECDNSAGTAAVNHCLDPGVCDEVEPGGIYTVLVEIRNMTATGASGSHDIYTQQIANEQFWGNINGAAIDDEHVVTTLAINFITGAFVDGSATLRAYKIADTEHLTGDPIGLLRYVIRNPAGSTTSFDWRISVYRGIYDGPYKPYSGPKVFASQAEFKLTSDGISAEVSKISSAKYVNATAASWALSSLQRWAAEGASTNWNVESTADLRVGDTVYIKGTDSTRICPVYVKVTVSQIKSATQIQGIGHGYEDVLPVKTIKSTINQSADSVKIQAKHVDIEGAAIFSSGRLSTTSLNDAYDAKGAADTALSDAKDYAEGVVSDTQGGYTILWNYSAFATANNGECYICKRDPLTETRTDEAGWVMWNGVKRTIPKGMVDPNAIHPFNIPCYVVCRLTSATATTGANYVVSYNSGWKGGVINAGALSDWTWNDATDIILGKFVMTAAEGAMVECELYNPPWSSKQITTNTVTAQGAAPKTSAVAEEQYIYISKAAGTASVSGTTTWVTASGDTQDAWTTKRPTYSGEYPVLFVAKQKKVVSGTVTCTTPVKDDTTTVIDGGHITTGEIDTARLNVSDIKDEGDFVTGSELDVEADRISSTVGDLDAALSENVDGLESLAARMSAIEQTASQIQTSVSNVEGDVTTLRQTDSALEVEIASAAKSATDYLTFSNGTLTLGASGNAVKAELSASQLAFVASGSTPASIGVEDGSGVLLIDNARVTDMLKFGDFAWIKRDNGNMTLKWIGA